MEYPKKVMRMTELVKMGFPEEMLRQATIQKGDYIVCGIGPEISSLKELQKLITDTCKVTAWSDNRRGGLPHWRIEGV